MDSTDQLLEAILSENLCRFPPPYESVLGVTAAFFDLIGGAETTLLIANRAASGVWSGSASMAAPPSSHQ